MVKYHEIDGTVTEISFADYFRDKPINYEKYILINESNIELYPECDKIALMGSMHVHTFNPYFKPDEFLSKNYEILAKIPGSGGVAWYLKNK